MEPSEYRTIFTVEDRHWWYVGMRRITLALLDEAYGRSDLRILDAGSGTGAAMSYLARYGRVTGIDLSPLALAFCRERALSRLSQASVTALPFADASFDLVTSFDVLYHRAVGDYRHALREFHRVLRPGGRLLLRLPAHDRLRGRHDVVIHTARRFSKSELSTSLHENGFVVERLTYANTLLFPAAVAKRMLEPWLPATPSHSDVTPNSPWLDQVLSAVLGLEACWLRRRDLPFGLSVVALAHKR
ncbi:MAG: class I SAM-dependent methyltransferase [Candidatus Promineofilum sp.]|nr:class I SAM-dependent methyltransferase [Promineifilum sp.]